MGGVKAPGISSCGRAGVPECLPARSSSCRDLFLNRRKVSASHHSDDGMDTKRRYIAFDIETTKVMEDASDWRESRPLGISCAATLPIDDQPRLWHGGTDRTRPADQMSREEAAALVEYLTAQVAQGYTLLTWNGIGFDLDVLAEESQMLDNCRQLAANHVNMMFHVVCRLGYGVSLDAAARGMGLAGKPEGMTGAVAPVLWARGEREKVLAYVGQDTRTTLELALKCESVGAFRWIARSGKVRRMMLPDGWLTAGEALELPLPNTSWMSEPWPRERFTGWMG